MKKYIIDYISKLESYKSGIKQLHWSAKNLSQHKLCDDIAEIIAEHQDKIAEVEQSITGKFPLNVLAAPKYKVVSLKNFVNDVISSATDFKKKVEKEDDKYIGMKSDVEAFLSDLQRQSYLVDFTIKEALKERLRNKINENRVNISDGNETYSFTENELREIVSEAISNTKQKLNESVSEREIAFSEIKHYFETLKEFRNKTGQTANLMLSAGYRRFANYLGEVLRKVDSTLEYLEGGEFENEYDR